MLCLSCGLHVSMFMQGACQCPTWTLLIRSLACDLPRTKASVLQYRMHDGVRSKISACMFVQQCAG